MNYIPSLIKREHLNISWWLCLQDVSLILRSIFFGNYLQYG
jgi:hypothetical protein